MATKQKQKGKPSKQTPKRAAKPLVEIIVRRGALRRFDALKRKTAELPVVLSWDRRLDERRSSATPVEGERRKADRRAKPPFTWELSDFVVVAPRPNGKRQVRSKAKK